MKKIEIDFEKYTIIVQEFSCKETYLGLYEGTVNDLFNQQLVMLFDKELSSISKPSYLVKPLFSEDLLPTYQCQCKLLSVPKQGFLDDELRHSLVGFYTDCQKTIHDEVFNALMNVDWENISEEYMM